MHWPFRQYETSRNVRLSPLHDRLVSQGACFGEVAGWERANWFAPPGVEPTYTNIRTANKTGLPIRRLSIRAVRENVGLFDQTSFSKFLLQGKDAVSVLNRHVREPD